jgi:hypothetical protein
MDNQQGAELNQLSRILFDRAAYLWQCSIILELVAGAIGVLASIAKPSLDWSTIGAIIVALLIGFAYYFRFKYEGKYDIAETMRRQSVLSEGLGWPISKTQFNEWKIRAGNKTIEKHNTFQRPYDYYETTRELGAKKLAEMTYESAFWTKNLYRKIGFYFSSLLIGVVIAFILLISVSVLPYAEQDLRIYFVYTIYLLIPVLLTIDFLGIALRSHRSIHPLGDIERHLEEIIKEDSPKIEEVMRLVSEYNCIVSVGIPIPKWLFKIHHDEIAKIWK